MATNLTQESQELLGTPKSEANQIATQYQTARSKYGGGGLTGMIEAQMREESQTRSVRGGMDEHEKDMVTVTETRTRRERADDGYSMG